MGSRYRGDWLSTSAKASLSPSRESTRYQGLLVSLEHRWVLGGLRGRKELVTMLLSAPQSADVPGSRAQQEDKMPSTRGGASLCLIPVPSPH